MRCFRLILFLLLGGLTCPAVLHAYTIFTDEAAFKQVVTSSLGVPRTASAPAIMGTHHGSPGSDSPDSASPGLGIRAIRPATPRPFTQICTPGNRREP